jgi:hypothetical protein
MPWRRRNTLLPNRMARSGTIPAGTRTPHRGLVGMIDDAPEQEGLERQMHAAADAIRAAVLRLLQDGEIHPQLVVLALARVTGEVGASAALAGGQDVETTLGKLAEVVREAGREFHEVIDLETVPPAGSA